MLSLFRAIDPVVPECLVPREARAPIHDVLAGLPPCWEWGMYECRLRPEPDRVDMLVYTSWHAGGRDILSKSLPDPTFRALLGSSLPLAEEWVREGSLLGRGTPLIWLEYDMLEGRPPDPFTFIQLDPEYLEPYAPGTGTRPVLPPDEVHAIAEAGMKSLLGDAYDPRPVEVLRRCAEVLPPGARVLHLAATPQRGVGFLKSGVAMYHWELAGWLKRAGWEGDLQRLEPLLDLMGPGWGRTALHIEVDENGLRLPIALEFQLASSQFRGPSWFRLVEGLVRRGLCTPEKGQAVLDWNGGQMHTLPDWPWRIYLEQQSFFKFVAQEDGSLESKAYLGIRPEYRLVG